MTRWARLCLSIQEAAPRVIHYAWRVIYIDVEEWGKGIRGQRVCNKVFPPTVSFLSRGFGGGVADN